jgi:TetR/AcrR family transcriptional regulator, regulator of autoinduction and epiphytic fitness
VQRLVHCALVTTVVDGRAARKAATRAAIADALLDLVTDGKLRPTAREIAERAGISLRSVYHHFDDLEDLFCVAARRQFDRVAPMLAPVEQAGPLRERAESVVRRRADLYDRFGPIRHATELQAPFSPTLQRLVSQSHARGRAELARVFATELDALAPRTRARVLASVDALTTGSAWDLLRIYHELAKDEAERTMTDAVVTLLERPT